MVTRTRLRESLGGGSTIAVAMAVMNIGTYGFTMLAARLLGPKNYGALASLMATLLVIGVLQLGLQATAARRIAAEPEHVAQIERSINRVTVRAAFALGALLLLLTPLINLVCRLDSLTTAALVGVTAVPLTIMGGQAGILQGERRWRPLSALYIAAGLPRLVIGIALVLWHPDETSAILGVAIAAVAPVLVGRHALRHGRAAGASSDKHHPLSIIWETVHNSHALLAFFALSNVDVILARNVLGHHDAGLYAAGLILSKAVLFLPQFVVVVAFPSMSTASERRRALTSSLLVVAVLGAVGTAATAVLPGLALIFVGGDDYSGIRSHLWIFAVLGTILSMLQLLVYSVLARQAKKSVSLIWVAFIVIVLGAGGRMVNTLDGLLTLVVVTDLVLFVVLLGISLWKLPRVEAGA
jgi:O-antigen/teichoic acid export membrane protein